MVYLLKLKFQKKNCKITLLKTGQKTLTGGRLKRVANFLKHDENFMFTYGDGLSDVNLKKLFNFHKNKKTSYCYCSKTTSKIW